MDENITFSLVILIIGVVMIYFGLMLLLVCLYIVAILLLFVGFQVPDCIITGLEISLDCFFDHPICCNPSYYLCCDCFPSYRDPPPVNTVVILNPFNAPMQLGTVNGPENV